MQWQHRSIAAFVSYRLNGNYKQPGEKNHLCQFPTYLTRRLWICGEKKYRQKTKNSSKCSTAVTVNSAHFLGAEVMNKYKYAAQQKQEM